MLKSVRKPGIYLGKQDAAQLRIVVTIYFRNFSSRLECHIWNLWILSWIYCFRWLQELFFFHSIFCIWSKVRKMFGGKDVQAKRQKAFLGENIWMYTNEVVQDYHFWWKSTLVTWFNTEQEHPLVLSKATSLNRLLDISMYSHASLEWRGKKNFTSLSALLNQIFSNDLWATANGSWVNAESIELLGLLGPLLEIRQKTAKKKLFYICLKRWELCYQSHLWTLHCLRCATHPSCFTPWEDMCTGHRHHIWRVLYSSDGEITRGDGAVEGSPQREKERGRERAWGHSLCHPSSLQLPHRR